MSTTEKQVQDPPAKTNPFDLPPGDRTDPPLPEMTKGQVTAQQLKEIGMHTSVINRLVSQLVLSDELDRMNLGASDELLKEQLNTL